MAEKSEDSDLVSDIAIFVVLLLLLVVAFIPTIIGVVLYLVFSRFLSRNQFLIAGVVGLVTSVIMFKDVFVTYPTWLFNLLVHQQFVVPPVLPIISLSLVVSGVTAAFAGTNLSARLPGKFNLSLPTARPSQGSILPSDQQKEQLTAVVDIPNAAPASTSRFSTKSKPDPSSSLAPRYSEEDGHRDIVFAVDRQGAPISINEDELRMHGFILGSTGSGKTVTIKSLAGALLDLGWDGMILDLKEDSAPGGLRDWCETYSTSHHIPYQELCLSDPNPKYWFNLLSGMGPDEMRDTILALQEFDDAYWQALNKALLGQIVNLMNWAHQVNPVRFPEPSMYEMGKILSTGKLPASTKQMRAAVLESLDSVTADDFRDLVSPDTAMQQSATGYGSRLMVIYDTQAGRTMLRPDPSGRRRQIDVTQRGLTYIGLDSQGKKDLTKVISSAVLQRMGVYAADRITGKVENATHRRFVIVDEANWINREIAQNLLSRARSAHISLILCTQGPMDWIDKNGDDWSKLTQNTNVGIIMSQGELSSAELCADYIGRVYKEQRSEMRKTAKGVLFDKPVRSSTGEIIESESVRNELMHIVDPDDLRRLSVGEAIIRVGKPSEKVSWAKIVQRSPEE